MSEILLAFVFVFLAALPGRTTFVLLLLGSSSRPGRILAGAIPAFLIQCVIAVLIGQVLKLLPHAYIELLAGALFVYFSYKFWKESNQAEAEDAPIDRSVASIFLLFFMAELGDVSQLAIATKAAESNSPFAVLVGACFAMSLIAVGAVAMGKVIGRFFSQRILQRVAAAVFGITGLYLLVSGAAATLHS